MVEWVEKRLSEVGRLQRGRSRHRPRYAFHLYGGKYPFVQTGEIKAAAKYVTSFEQTYSEDGLSQSKLWDAGTLCITIAANIADVAILSFPACFPDSVIGFIPNEKESDLQFVFYTLKHFQRELQAFGDGSVQDNINLGTFEQIKFPFPDVPEQKAIAEVLSSLDDKIDLLHRQNKTLESLAQTLFRQWFIEEAEEKLANGTTHKLVELVDTISETFKFTEEPVVFLNTSDIYGGTVLTHELSNPSILPGQAKKRIKKGDILYSEIRPINKRYAFIDFDAENYVVSTKLMVLRAKPNVSSAILYFYLTHPDTMNWLQMIAESRSGTFPQITFDQVKEMKINFPDEKRLLEISEWAESTMSKISRNCEQIQTVAKLRDSLLPKLMTGDVRIENVG